MDFEGIYRKTGGASQVKMIQACFDRGEEFDLEDQDRFNDLGAITSCLKNYFRTLPDPLYTHNLHEDFLAAVESRDNKAALLDKLEKCLALLPTAHWATLKTLMDHLYRCARASALFYFFTPHVLITVRKNRERRTVSRSRAR